MAAIDWKKVRGQEFTQEEAQAASDFGEIVELHGLSLEAAYAMFKGMGNGLGVGQRLLFAEQIDIDRATILLLCDSDERIRGVVDERIKEFREKSSGGIITARG